MVQIGLRQLKLDTDQTFSPAVSIAMGSRSTMTFRVVVPDAAKNLFVANARVQIREGTGVVGNGTILTISGWRDLT
jgi:hypothetical protein